MRIDWLVRAHSLVGWLGLLAFIVSGMLLRRSGAELHGGDETLRALFRANHIYLLAAALLNLLAARVGPVPSSLRTKLRFLGSSALLVALPLLASAFFSEEPGQGLEPRHVTRAGLYALFAGALLVTVTTPKAREI